ncbi:MAG: hypothetical protein COV52_05990 [Gammaproteobacteria bacterium CG11_big_fil_rev_8_21_14_0_20_46_22]|nr:MAG: hypothetical protein COW05_07670 [Gammaproteobacteria bacterium CG12_big_fil_rev_8_21_14_0_65_46_12]PIR11054.1 MAG: hypothetical protein COV52_05990 [Gammaproteobacteria bacterium CG11_big_fil_rev_8_21_14_0_20_46_22]
MFQEPQNALPLCSYFIEQLEADPLYKEAYSDLIARLRCLQVDAQSDRPPLGFQPLPSVIGNILEYQVADECQKKTDFPLRRLLLTYFNKQQGFNAFLLTLLSPYSLVRVVARGYYLSLGSSEQGLKGCVGNVINAVEAITESGHVNQNIQTEVLPSLRRVLGENSKLEQLILAKLGPLDNQPVFAPVSFR